MAGSNAGRMGSAPAEGSNACGTDVLIRRGRLPIWRELKDFIEDWLRRPVDESNRLPMAGVPKIARLAEMTDTAAIALLVMTGEDEQPVGQLRGRMNVVHESGLFQGSLGFARGVALFDDDCEEFSNIAGLGQIRFPRGSTRDALEAIR